MTAPVAGAPGPGVDARGNQLVDPSENVKALSEAANKRQDDLRESSEALTVERIGRIKEVADLHAKHLREISDIRAAHANELNQAETKRLDSIRQVDVTAVGTAAMRADTAIQALATQTASSAETLRSLVASTATAVAAQLQATIAPIIERISLLEKSSYEGKGKAGVADPMMSELVIEMKALRQAGAVGAGRSAGVGASFGGIATVIGVVGTLVAIAVTLAVVLSK